MPKSTSVYNFNDINETMVSKSSGNPLLSRSACNFNIMYKVKEKKKNLLFLGGGGRFRKLTKWETKTKSWKFTSWHPLYHLQRHSSPIPSWWLDIHMGGALKTLEKTIPSWKQEDNSRKKLRKRTDKENDIWMFWKVHVYYDLYPIMYRLRSIWKKMKILLSGFSRQWPF